MERKYREEIFRKIIEFYKLTKKRKFIPGKDRINYAGRVYDEKEIINLVDASLDFWLTMGRYTQELERKLACLLYTSPSPRD